jgi:hypothetical protein
MVLNERGDRLSGQQGFCCNGAGNSKGFADGPVLWLPSRNGVVTLDTRSIVRNLRAPTVVIERVQSQGRWQPVGTPGMRDLPPQARDVGFEFTALSFQALSGHPVRTSLWDSAAEAAMGHIELARWADRILIAPATADLLARLTHGFANDLVTTLCLATTAPITVAPAMNHRMWQHPATVANLAVLRARGVQIIGPEAGPLAEGESGPGRLSEPEDIVAALAAGHAPAVRDLAGVREHDSFAGALIFYVDVHRRRLSPINWSGRRDFRRRL